MDGVRIDRVSFASRDAFTSIVVLFLLLFCSEKNFCGV